MNNAKSLLDLCESLDYKKINWKEVIENVKNSNIKKFLDDNAPSISIIDNYFSLSNDDIKDIIKYLDLSNPGVVDYPIDELVRRFEKKIFRLMQSNY